MAPLGILAGRGELPREIAAGVTARGRGVFVVGLAGSADADYSAYPHVFLRIAALGAIFRAFKGAGCSELIMVGHVRRPDPWQLRPDIGGLLRLPRILPILSGGDDAILTHMVRFVEREGFGVAGVPQVAPELLAPDGFSAGAALTAEAVDDGRIGFEVVSAIGHLDIGQSVVVRGGKVLAIEAVEGTDQMLTRVPPPSGAARGVMAKRPKPGQEMRIDLPVIGPPTVARVKAAGLAGIVVEVGVTVIAERARLIADAEAAGIGLRALPGGAGGAASGRMMPEDDAALAIETAERLRPFGAGAGVVAARRHVLAVSGSESVPEMLARVPAQRQWFDRRSKKKRGVLALRMPPPTPSERAALVSAIERAGIREVRVPGEWATELVAEFEADLKSVGVEVVGG